MKYIPKTLSELEKDTKTITKLSILKHLFKNVK